MNETNNEWMGERERCGSVQDLSFAAERAGSAFYEEDSAEKKKRRVGSGLPGLFRPFRLLGAKKKFLYLLYRRQSGVKGPGR
jgi:hypothetical protein